MRGITFLSPFPTSLTVNVPQGSGCHVFPWMRHYYMTSFRRVFVLLVVAFTTDATPPLIFKSFDDLFAIHWIFVHTDTHCVKVKNELKMRSNPTEVPT
jgi:hypothetical protein